MFIVTGESRDIPQVRCRFGEGLQILGHFFEGSGSIPLSLCESCDLEPCHQPLPKDLVAIGGRARWNFSTTIGCGVDLALSHAVTHELSEGYAESAGYSA